MTQAELLPALQFTPPVLSLDFEELEKRIDGITEQYSGLIVSEDDVTPIKSEMAGLNKLAKQLADARKDAVSLVSSPIKEFEGRIKSLESKIVSTRSFLDEQVKGHVQRERESRRHAVKFIIDAQLDEHGISDLDIPIQESWLNKSAKDKQVSAEVAAIILAHKKAQEEKAALEQARLDRATAIENHNSAMSGNREYSLPVSGFYALQSLDIPLSQALKRIEEAYEAEDDRRMKITKADSVVKDKKEEPPHFMDFPDPAPAPQPQASPMRSMTITATYKPEKGAQINVLYLQLQALCETISVQVKEL